MNEGDSGTRPRTQPSKSSCICSAVPKNVTFWRSVALVEHLVGAGVLGQAVEGEMDLEVRGPVVDGVDPLGEGLGQVVTVEELGEGGRGVEVGHDDRRGDDLAVGQVDALDPTVGHGDLGDLDVAAELAAVLSRTAPAGGRTWCRSRLAPWTWWHRPGEARAKARHSALPGVYGPR